MAVSTTFNISIIPQTDAKVESTILGHYFYNSVTLILPGANSLPQSILECFNDQLFYKVHSLPIYRLVEVPFIQAFVKRGSIHMLSANTRLDTHDCVAVIPSGWLILHLTKDTYIELGLEASKQTHQQKSSDVYVVKINLLASHFKPGKKNYDSTLWCLKNRLGLTFDFYLTWEPHQKNVCSSSVSSYFLDKCKKVERGHLTRKMNVLTSLPFPKVKVNDPVGKSSDDACHYLEVFEWMGALACCVDMSVADDKSSYMSSLHCPEPSHNCPVCCLFQTSGFITPGTVIQLFKALRMYAAANPQSPPASLTTHGFRDSPIIHTTCPNHLQTCGDNLISFLYLPDNQCWLYRAVAS
ncbi:hypothetical protein RRG08_028819 [Elysia crispata]|uniref:Uncharacterized protein n=1 Tax=Elysia crispata TaxID=231223 RepID=A0AAE0XT51_9GAST|nr:hypothetical protein RRG08_028819 [Elysia crispata]